MAVYNIDHHVSRISDNDPDNNIHVIKSCSTSALLYSRFGIKDDILAVGVYTDTLFTKCISEVFYFLDDFNMDEEKLNSFISRVNVNSDKKVWDILTTAKVRKCRNGFVIVETDEFGSPDVLESVMQILSKLNESVCFIYGKHKTVKLRTSNIYLDLSEIAKHYSGGGHPYASMCKVNGKVSEFKHKIISLDVPKTYYDGYGTSQHEEDKKE
jgi:nanoRNase/pAp phosphatase (c-di-AMP/oligoRNAs hydrolase)